MNFKERYRKIQEEIKPSVELKEETIKNMNAIRRKEQNNMRENQRWKPVIVGGILVVGSMVSLPALAETIQNIYELMPFAPKELAVSFVPIEMSVVREGIKLEVVAMDIEENRAKLYVTLQDEIGGRMNETVQLGSYTIAGYGGAVAGSEFYAYEEVEQKVTFMITLEDFKQEEIQEELTFILYDISTANQEFHQKDIWIPMDIEETIAPSVGTRDIDYKGGSGFIEDYLGATSEVIEIKADGDPIMKKLPLQGLLSNIEPIDIGAEGALITAVTYKEGKLSIQYTKANDSHSGYLYLQHKETKEELHCQYSFSGLDWEEAEQENLYGEYIFEIEPEELSAYELYGKFRVGEELIKGDWNVSFDF